MNQDLNNLVDTLRKIAYDAGFALLFPVDSDTTQRYADRYNCAFGQLRQLAPHLTTAPLPNDATAGGIRIAARTAVAQAQGSITNCFHRIAA